MQLLEFFNLVLFLSLIILLLIAGQNFRDKYLIKGFIKRINYKTNLATLINKYLDKENERKFIIENMKFIIYHKISKKLGYIQVPDFINFDKIEKIYGKKVMKKIKKFLIKTKDIKDIKELIVKYNEIIRILNGGD
jgi:hypothetical protein